jgi:small subunit ribosomal protein S18
MSMMTKKMKEKRKKRNKFKKFAERTRCRWCDRKQNCEEAIKVIDYKNVDLLQKLVTAQGKLFSRKRSSSCAQAQQRIKSEIKKARILGLMPFVG